MAKAGSEPPEYAEVALSIYELHGSSALNVMTNLAGLGGAYHVGVEVYWLEWSFGWCEEGSGIYMVHTGKSGLGTYVDRVPLGRTPLKPKEVIKVLDDFRKTWDGPSYDLLRRNCAHFSKAFVDRLHVSEETPEWVNSLAAVGDRLVSGFGSEEAAEQAARNATPAAENRAPPPMAMVDDDDTLEDMAYSGNDLAMRELAWRRATDFVFEKAAALERSARFEDFTTDFRWGPAPATFSAEKVRNLKEDLVHDTEFREALVRSAFVGLGRPLPSSHDRHSDDDSEAEGEGEEEEQEEKITLLRIQALPANVVRVRFRLHSSSDEEQEWPPKMPESKDFAAKFSAEMRRAVNFSRRAWREGSKMLVSRLEVITAPGKAAFGERVETAAGPSGEVKHGPPAAAAPAKLVTPAATLHRLERLAASARHGGGRQARRPGKSPGLLRAR